MALTLPADQNPALHFITVVNAMAMAMTGNTLVFLAGLMTPPTQHTRHIHTKPYSAVV